jgi:hypothetical protein
MVGIFTSDVEQFRPELSIACFQLLPNARSVALLSVTAVT